MLEQQWTSQYGPGVGGTFNCSPPNSCLTGIEENLTANSINVFPNPSSGKFTIQYVGTQNPDSYRDVSEIQVYNVFGEKVYSAPTGFPKWESVSFSYEINLSAQPNGIYFYRVVSESGELIGEGKLIIQK
jgi:hypothetical protein